MDFLIEAGEEKTETRYIGNFSYIVINDLFNITLVPDTSYYISITCGKNILPFISLDNKNGHLTIDNKISGRWARPYKLVELQIHMPQLDTFELNTTSNVTSIDTITCNEAFIFVMADLADVDITVKGNFLYFHTARTSSGHYKLKGRLENVFMNSGGTSVLDSRQLFVKKAAIWHNSISDMNVFVAEEIYDLKSFKGAVLFIYGNPTTVVYSDVGDKSKIIFK